MRRSVALPVALLAWVYAGYPLAAFVAGRVRPVRVRSGGAAPRIVTVGIAVHDEAAQIAERVEDALAQVLDAELEVVVASDGSVDATETIVEGMATRDPRVRLLRLPRGGQTAAQNAIVANARGDVVVLTDAETRFDADCLRALTAPFADPRVGCTTGRLVWRNQADSDTSRNEGLYWRYERAVRALESRAGWLTAATGALLAARREVCARVPEHASFDHLVPLYARERGLLVLSVPEATAGERLVASVEEQFRNRTRTATRGLQANLSMLHRLAPWDRPTAALAIWSHKLLRWATPLLSLWAVAAATVEAVRGRRRYGLVPLAALATGAGALVELARRRRGRTGSRATSLALSVGVVHAAFASAWLNLIRRRRIHHWRRPAEGGAAGPGPGAVSERPVGER